MLNWNDKFPPLNLWNYKLISEKDVQDYKQAQWPQPTKGVKYDSDKPPMALLDNGFLCGIASVLGFGANKYAAHNWRGGIEYSRLISAAYRHLGAINEGEDLDKESGLPHVHHLGCCVMFLANMMKERPDMDDRYKK
jgi:Domain of unknown function (DUF5664)